MANKTAMQVLKSKIQDAIGEINGELNLYSSGYKQCLINIQNDIDAQMMEMEKEQSERMYSEEDLRNAYRWGTTVNHGTKEHFNEWFEQLKKKSYDKTTNRS